MRAYVEVYSQKIQSWIIRIIQRSKFLKLENPADNKIICMPINTNNFIILLRAHGALFEINCETTIKNFSDLKNDLTWKQKTPHISFNKFLKTNNGNRPIDLLQMDISGDEFAIFKFIVSNPTSFPPICQISVDFHKPKTYPPNGYNIFETLKKMSTDKSFLILNSTFVKKIHKIYMVNLKDPYCQKSFFPSFINKKI